MAAEPVAAAACRAFSRAFEENEHPVSGIDATPSEA
jgi:hypothetical protein